MGRDNKMYHLNEGYNLEMPKQGNIFDEFINTRVFQDSLLNQPSQISVTRNL